MVGETSAESKTMGVAIVRLFPTRGSWKNYAHSRQTHSSWTKSHQTHLASDGYLYAETEKSVPELNPSQLRSTDLDPDSSFLL